jgi:hypothetical protein
MFRRASYPAARPYELLLAKTSEKPPDFTATVSKNAGKRRIYGFRLILRAHLSRSRVWLKF